MKQTFLTFGSIIFCLLFLSGCDNVFVPGQTSQASDFDGTWVFESYEDDLVNLQRAEALDEQEYGFIARSDGEFLERKNAGFCGTPPITYSNFDGKWEFSDKNLIDIKVGYWGGETEYQIEIVELDSEALKIRYIYPTN